MLAEINLHQPALLPEDYCADVHERLVIYKRLANCRTAEEISDMAEELIDRFGQLPEPARTLLESHKLRLLAKPLGISRLDAAVDSLTLQFVPNPPINPVKILQLVQTRRDIKLAGQDRLRLQGAFSDLRAKASATQALLAELSSP
jgi:transcription-repair coupling factor (superfamily II helicase)